MSMDSDPGAVWRRLPPGIPAPLLRCALLALVTLAAACDFPTGLPKWQTEWLVPVENTTVAVGQLLPSSLAVTPDNTAFTLSIAPVTPSASLAELCTICGGLSGVTVPKPAFTAILVDTLRLPSDVPGATLASGTVALRVTNGFGFDPLRPSATARGTLTVTVASGGTSLGQVVLKGDSVALPPGGSVSRTIALTPGAVASRLVVQMTLVSPAGDAVHIDATQRLSLTATPQSLRLSDVTVSVNQKQASIQPFELDLTGVDESLSDRVQGGSLLLSIVNPWAVTGTMALRFTSSNMAPISKTVPLAAGSSTPKVDFTPEELRSMLGRQVSVTASGAVTAGQAVKLTPSQAVQVTAKLSLIIGSQES